MGVWFAPVLRAPRDRSFGTAQSRACGLDCAPPLGGNSTDPRGPRSGPGCSVPVRHHLLGPIRPARGHIAISPHSGLYAMPSLCGSAEATREWFRLRCTFPPGMPSSLTPGSSITTVPEQRCRHLPSPSSQRLVTPITLSQSVSRGALFFEALWFAFRCGLPSCSPPVINLTGHCQASGCSISRLPARQMPAAGYDDNSDWTPLLAGLSPAGMAASLAAREPDQAA